jgi:hypothetical protein
VEVVNPKSGVGMWRGSSQQGIPDRATDDAKTKRVEEAVAALLTRFPPK